MQLHFRVGWKSEMATCNKCGNQIEFRYVDGRCIPLHLHGQCNYTDGANTNDYSGYNISRESTCFSTHCPKCGDEVFFIRHNGGSVWIDAPLGPPWYKHSCLETSHAPSARKNLAFEYKLTIQNTQNEPETALTIGIVKSTRVDVLRKYSDLSFETGERPIRKLRLQHNAGFLLGKLCVYDTINAEIWPIDEPSYVYSVLRLLPPISDLISCPKCGVKLNPKNLLKHLKVKHLIWWIQARIIEMYCLTQNTIQT